MKVRHFFGLLDHYYDVYNALTKIYSVEHALGNYINIHRDSLRLVPITKLYGYAFDPMHQELWVSGLM
jgi:hypothetical protein